MGTIITEDMAHLIVTQVVFFSPIQSITLSILYFPVPVVTFLLKTYPEAHPLDVNS